MMVGAVLAINGATTVGAIFVFLILGGQLASSMLQLSTVSDQYQDARQEPAGTVDTRGSRPGPGTPGAGRGDRWEPGGSTVGHGTP